MHEDQHAQGRIHGGIDEPVRACTSESRVQPGCYGDKAMYVEHHSCYNHQKWHVFCYCKCVGEELADAEDEQNGDSPLSASREEVVIGLEEDLVESTVEVGKHWRGLGV